MLTLNSATAMIPCFGTDIKNTFLADFFFFFLSLPMAIPLCCILLSLGNPLHHCLLCVFSFKCPVLLNVNDHDHLDLQADLGVY